MTRDDILRMAREASNTPIDHRATPDLFGVNQLERFAALIAAHEREACAAICDEEARGINPKYGKIMAMMLGERIRGRGEA